jgi:hypothetical protein
MIFAGATLLNQSIANGLINTTNTATWSGGNGGNGSSVSIVTDIDQGAVNTTLAQYNSYIASVPTLPQAQPSARNTLNTRVYNNNCNIIKCNTNGSVQWVADLSGGGQVVGYSMGTDGQNIYVTGSFYNTMTIINADRSIFRRLLPLPGNLGPNCTFTVKYNLAGKAQWAAQISSAHPENGQSITTDGANSYMAGQFSPTVKLYNADGTPYQTWFQNRDNGNLSFSYVVKYNPNGAIVWATQLVVENGFSNYHTIILGPSGLYAIGYFGGTNNVTLYNSSGTGALSLRNRTGLAQETSIISKYNSDGIVQWATIVANNSYSNGYSITVDSQDNLYAVGVYTSQLSVYSANNQSSPAVRLPASANSISYLVKYNSAGNVQWGTYFSGSNQVFSITIDSTGIYIVGTYVAPILFYNNGGGALGPLPYISSNNAPDGFIVKYNTNGVAQWATLIHGNNDGVVNPTTVTVGGGYVYVSGFFFSHTVTPYSTPLGSVNSGITINNSSYGSYNNFLIQYDQNGIVQWGNNGNNPFTTVPLFSSNDSTYSDSFYNIINAR